MQQGAGVLGGGTAPSPSPTPGAPSPAPLSRRETGELVASNLQLNNYVRGKLSKDVPGFSECARALGECWVPSLPSVRSSPDHFRLRAGRSLFQLWCGLQLTRQLYPTTHPLNSWAAAERAVRLAAGCNALRRASVVATTPAPLTPSSAAAVPHENTTTNHHNNNNRQLLRWPAATPRRPRMCSPRC